MTIGVSKNAKIDFTLLNHIARTIAAEIITKLRARILIHLLPIAHHHWGEGKSNFDEVTLVPNSNTARSGPTLRYP